MAANPGSFLDLDREFSCIVANFRRFDPGEYHVTRLADYDVLLMMLEGELIFYEDGRRVSLTPGQWYIQKAGLLQEGGEPSRLPYYYFLHFRGSYGDAFRHPLPLSGEFLPEEFLPLFRQMDRVWRTDASAMARQAAFSAILAKLEESAPASPVSETVKGMMDYLAEHLSEGVRVVDLARAFNYSEDHVIRLFRRWKGVTPHRLIREMQLKKAELLLETTDRGVSEIAAQCGFRDPSVFYRAFRREKGVAPEAWKKRQNASAPASRKKGSILQKEQDPYKK